MKTINYEVRRHFKDEDGYNYETLFTSNNEAEAEAFRNKLPKDNKKVQYTVKGYFKVTITKADAREYDRIHKAIWTNMTDDKLASVF